MTRPLDAAAAEPLAVVTRSGFPESVHSGAAVVLAPDGAERRRIGDPDRLVYPRSALKPFQTVAAVRAGARFSPEQLVVVTSSHGGTPRHVGLVRSVLAGAGLTEDALRTPVAWPSSAEAARDLVRAGLGAARILMNCSGNHAGMLAGSVAAGWPVDDYLDPAHPIHALAAQVNAELGGAAPANQGVDGCGGPVWAIPVTALAEGYRRIAAEQPGLAAAIRAHPDLIEGPGTPTTRAVAALGVVAKSGAEGVFVAVAPDGTTAAVKVLDGAGRAAAAVAVALLADAGAVDALAAEAFLDDPGLVVTGGGAPVGRIRVLGR
ncbi:MAG: asparaginase [Amnibacterium sp.]